MSEIITKVGGAIYAKLQEYPFYPLPDYKLPELANAALKALAENLDEKGLEKAQLTYDLRAISRAMNGYTPLEQAIQAYLSSLARGNNMKRKYGYKPDLGDWRDYKFSVVHAAKPILPIKVDLSAKLPPVFDQGQLGSCTANALSCALGALHPGFVGSRLQIYYDERVIEGDVRQDNGAQIRDGIKVLNKIGAEPETEWPYIVSKFKIKPKVFTDGKRITTYSRLSNSADYHNCIAAGFVFVIGFTVYESFESETVAKSGVVPMPTKSESVVGGHAVCVYGYDDVANVYLARNSWGAQWGNAGSFSIPQTYLNNPDLATDAWSMRA